MQVHGAAHQDGQIIAGLADRPHAGLGVRRQVLPRKAAREISHAFEPTQNLATHALDEDAGGVLGRRRARPARGQQRHRRSNTEVAAVLDHDEAADQGVRPGGQQMFAEPPGGHAGLGDGRARVHDFDDRTVAVGLGEHNVAGQQAHGLAVINHRQDGGLGFSVEPGGREGAKRTRGHGRAAIHKTRKSVHKAGRRGQNDLQHRLLHLKIG